MITAPSIGSQCAAGFQPVQKLNPVYHKRAMAGKRFASLNRMVYRVAAACKLGG